MLNCLGHETKVPAADGQITLRILIDRTSIEVFANGGKVSVSSCYLPKPDGSSLEMFSGGSGLKFRSLTVHELKSAWSARDAKAAP